ncbi:tautomerase family protein [Bordetella genomosp. 5]|uniref:4-oxalocrotonate tautomerase n=1 Tax=Bordetella genomosp. 5 TaxID=1395608 RepID=A0A261TNP2_9BORD|nr:tautomerase family protein [Bordetella genomosp. 5]OZI50233.1 4-oxalocrotonate tautomerase [Bordetella genomosp. 5]
MPHIVIHLSGAPDAARDERVVQATMDLTQRVLGKERDVIAITVLHVPAAAWYVGGRSLADLARNAFHLDISVTDETNTKAEKAAYLKEVHTAFAAILEPLHEVSYVHVIDARAAAYGYGGRTQEYRHQHRPT